MRGRLVRVLERAGISGKLVRDKIPQIIRSRSADPLVRVAAQGEYRELLRAKLTEEVTEVLGF